MSDKCYTCANANIYTGAYTHTCYIECGNKPDVKKMSDEELLDRIQNPQKYENECVYKKGKPQDCGITFDD